MSKCITFTTPNMVYEHKIDNRIGEKLNMRHCHDDYEIIYVVKGEGSLLVEGVRFELRPRSLLLIRPFEYHFAEIEQTGDYERHVIHFSPMALTKEIREIFDTFAGSARQESGIFYTPDNLSTAATAAFDSFSYANLLSDSDRQIYANLILSQLIFLLSVSKNQLIAHDDMELGARVAKYISDRIDADCSLDTLAKRFFVSKYYLCHSFKKYSGVPIHSYINHKRVLYAKQLIDKGETASGAAYKVGFGDYSAFYRAYVKVFGTPPTAELKRKQACTVSKSNGGEK